MVSNSLNHGFISLVPLLLVLLLPSRHDALYSRFLMAVDWAWPGVIDVAIAGAAFGVLVTVDLWWFRRQRAAQVPSALIDVPGPAERPWWIALSVSSGIGEELTWRLVQPMLIVGLTGNTAIAIGLSAAAFGVGHLRAGWPWVAITILFALVFQTITLMLAGGWYLAALMHVAINLASGLVPSFSASREEAQ